MPTSITPPIVAQIQQQVLNNTLGAYYAAGVVPDAFESGPITTIMSGHRVELRLSLRLDRPRLFLRAEDVSGLW